MEFDLVREIEEYLEKIDLEEIGTSDPSFDLVLNNSIGFEKKIDIIIVHYAGLVKDVRDWTFRQNEPLDAFFETIVCDPIGDTDPNLKEFLEDIQAEYSIILPQNFETRKELVKEMNKRIIDLSNEVHDFFGRKSNDAEYKIIDNECTKRINHLKNERNSNLIYLGDLKGCGLCRHRSILFKVVCDMSGIPCRILRGVIQPNNPHVWNEVRLVQLISQSTHFIDAMNFRDGFVTEEYLSKFKSHDEGTKFSVPNEMTTKLIEQNYPENRSRDSIGSGAFGVVYEIRNGDYVNPNDNQIEKIDFAVKVFNITEKIKIIPRIEKYIKREIENLELLRHPNIIEIIGSFESESEHKDRLINILMKRYPFHGKDFLQNLDVHEEKKKVCILQYFMEICKGLDFIHSNGKIHFDIKPENILIRLDEDCKRIIDVRIADFGSIKEQEFNLSLTTDPQTTKRYRAPEISNGNLPFTPMSDIYSFGVLMKEFEVFYKGFPKMEELIERCQLNNPIERPTIIEIKYCIRSTLEMIRQKIYIRNLKLDPFQPPRCIILKQFMNNEKEQDEMKKKNHILENEKNDLKREQDELKKKYEIEKNELERKQKEDLRIIRVEKTNLEKIIQEKVSKKWKGFFFLLIVVLFVSLLVFAISYKAISNDLRTEKELQRITESKNQEFKKKIFTFEEKKEKLERFFDFSTVLSFDQYFELTRVSDFNTSWTLLYRGSRDNYTIKSFHSKCDNFKETLVIIKSDKNYVFGGFNPLKWNLEYGYHKAEGTWIFGFENNHKNIIKMNYNHNHKNAKGGIFCSSGDGPIFGRNAFNIEDNCNLKKTSFTWIIDEQGFDKGDRSDNFLNGGEMSFKVLDYEVFTKEK